MTRLTKEERRATLRRVGQALRSAREELIDARKKSAEMSIDQRQGALANALDKLHEIVGKMAAVPQMLPERPVNVTFDPEPIRSEITRLSGLVGQSRNTEPLAAEVSRLCDLVAKLTSSRAKPPPKYQASFKRNDFGQIVEALIEPVEEDD